MQSLLCIPIILIWKYMAAAQVLNSGKYLTPVTGNSLEISQETHDDGNIIILDRDDIVNTTSGPVQGHILIETPNIKRFYDIPYGSFSEANPFEAPTPPQPWEKVHNASEHTSRCPQVEYPDKFIGSTNCLTLSIMTPIKALNADVLFHIHGGTFNTGSGDPSVYGPEYIVPKGIILVLPNYRLGPLGFLCSQNATIPGNAALKDLTLALKWIKNNIAAFGGNPRNIVVSGEDTAGALAGYLAVSPTSREYVSKVIAESGFVLSHWALDRNPVATLEKLLQKLSTPIDTITSMAFKKNDFYIKVLVSAAKNMKFAPCVEAGETSFITETPWNMLHSLKTNVSYMIGSTSHAGMQEALDQMESSLSEINDDFGIVLPDDLDFEDNDKERSRIVKRIRAQYFGDDYVTLDGVELLSFCYTDASYLGPMIRAARPLVAAGAPVYFYEFSFVGDLNKEIVSSVKVHGATRGDVARYVFCHKGQVPDEGTKERQMVAVLTELWASFIHTGTPTAKSVEWHQLKQTTELNESWILIGSEIKPQRGLHLERLKLWTEIYETYFVEHNRAHDSPPYIYLLMFTLFLFVCFSKILI